MNNRKDELYHYGVLGMKWGKRKSALNRQNASDYKGKGLTVAQANRKAKKDAKAKKKIDGPFTTDEMNRNWKAYKTGRKISKVVAASIVADVATGGKLSKTIGQTVKKVGRKATEAWMYKRGAISVKWLD